MVTEAIMVKLAGSTFEVIGPGTTKLLSQSFQAYDFPVGTPDGTYSIAATSDWSGPNLHYISFGVPSVLNAQEGWVTESMTVDG